MENNRELQNLSDNQLDNLFTILNSRNNMTQNEYKPRNAGVYKIPFSYRIKNFLKARKVELISDYKKVRDYFVGFLYFCLTICMAGFFGILFCLIVNKFFSWLVH